VDEETGQPTMPYLTGEMSKSEWFSWTPFEKANWYYLNINKLLDDHDPDLWVEFQSIFKGEHKGFDAILEQLDIFESFQNKIFDRKINKSMKIIPPYNEWKNSWKEQILESLQWYESKLDDISMAFKD